MRQDVQADRDAFTAGRDIHFGEHLGEAGTVSISPPQPAFPVRGRDRLIRELSEVAGSVQVLYGVGGVGKTAVAAAVADRARAEGRQVWWVSAVDAYTLSSGMLALAGRLGADTERLRRAWSGDTGDAPDLVWDLLAAHLRPWLLIIDNADDLRLLAAAGAQVSAGTGWIRPPAAGGGVLVTSRHHDLDQWGSHIHSQPLLPLPDPHAQRQDDPAAQMLLDRAGPRAGDAADAAGLATRLGRLPLLLHQAGLYLHQARQHPPRPGAHQPRTFTAYLAAVNDRAADLLTQTGHPAAGEVAVSTWELSLDLLADNGTPLARPLLYVLAHCGEAPVPYAIALTSTVLAATPLFDTDLTDEDIDHAIDGLASVGLILRTIPDTDYLDDDQPGADHAAAWTITVPPIIAETFRHHPYLPANTLTAALTKMSDSLPATIHTIALAADLSTHLLPHQLAAAGTDTTEHARLYYNHAIDLARAGRRTEALGYSQRAVDLREELAEANRDTYLPDLASSINNHAIRLAKAGRRAEALEYSQRAVGYYEELAEANRNAYLPDLARSIHNHAVSLAEAGRRAEALGYSQRAVDLREELAAANRDAHLPDLASSIGNHAISLARAGRGAEALDFSQRAVDLREELAEANRDAYLPDLAMTLRGFAWVRVTLETDWDAALVCIERSIGAYRELAAQEPEAFQSLLDAAAKLKARVLDGLGRSSEAAEVRRSLEELNHPKLDENHGPR